MDNALIIIENKNIDYFDLNQKDTWSIGRPHKENMPDIKLMCSTVSREHGSLRCMDGYWFYVDNNTKNGTLFNGKHIGSGYAGRIKPVMLGDGDILMFGCKAGAVLTQTTPWAIYLDHGYDGGYRTTDTAGRDTVIFTDGETPERLTFPKLGTIVRRGHGMAIYMGDTTYLLGNMRMASA